MTTPIENNDNAAVKAAATTLPLLAADDRQKSSKNQEELLAEKQRKEREKKRRSREKERSNQKVLEEKRRKDRERKQSARETERSNQQALEEKRRKDRERKQKASKKSQQCSNPSTSTERMRQLRESTRMYHPDKAEKEKEKHRQSMRTIRARESEEARRERLRKQREMDQHRNRQKKFNHDDSDKENQPLRNHDRSRIRYQLPPRTSETSDEDDNDDNSHPTSPPLTPSRQQPNNLASSLDLNQLPLNEILKDMRFGDIDPEEVQNVSLPKHPATRELSNVFHRKIDEVVDSMYHCPMCKERFFERKPPDSKGDCKLCRSSMKKHNIQIMSVKNDMDPFPHGYPADFPMLTPIETMLISPAYPFMKVYTFANGATGFRGQILNVQQDISDRLREEGIINVRYTEYN
jgi:hypothetical protein